MVEQLAGRRVVTAANCQGGFSPGLTSPLTLADSTMIFVKAIDVGAWPDQAGMYRAESSVSAALPAAVPAPRLLASRDDGHWVVLVFEYIDGPEPDLLARPAEAFRVAAALEDLARMLTPSPIELPSDHPRLGGWADLASDCDRLALLPALSPWAANQPRHADHARGSRSRGRAGTVAGALRRLPAQHLADWRARPVR
jgi:hypothetical protein